MKFHDLVGSISRNIKVPAQAADAATAYVAAFRAPYKCRVTALGYVPIAAVTGQDTESRNLNVDLAAGTEVANLDLANGTNMAAKALTAIPITATGGYIDLEEGATLRLESELVGTTGLAVPLGNWIITFQGR